MKRIHDQKTEYSSLYPAIRKEQRLSGLMDDPDVWRNGWITGSYHANPGKRYPVDCFRKRFVILPEIHSKETLLFAVPKGQNEKPMLPELLDARLYISACGLYEATIN